MRVRCICRPKTHNSYRYRLFEKLRVKSNVELLLLAVKSGIPAPSFDSEEVLRQSPVNRASLMLVTEEDAVFLSSDPDYLFVGLNFAKACCFAVLSTAAVRLLIKKKSRSISQRVGLKSALEGCY